MSLIKSKKWLSACAIIILWLYGPVGGMKSQTSPQTSNGTWPGLPGGSNGPGTVMLHAQRNLVLVDVRVTDKSGKPITSLKQEDFRIYEDGKPQTINSFSFENVERLAAATGEGGAPAVINMAKLPPAVTPDQAIQNHRLLVLFFDMSSMPADDLIRTLQAATDFVNKRMTPADLVAVVTYTSMLNVNQDFTNDRDLLDKVIHSLQVGEATSLAESGATGEAGTTDTNGNEVVTQDVSAAFTPDETEFNIFNTDEKLAAIESLAKMLQDVPGRKSVIHFSSGIERTGLDNQTELRAAEDAANRANVSLYTVDSRGLMALPPGGDASTASPSGSAGYRGEAIHSQITSMQESRETLAALSADTGGRTFYDMNDFDLAFRQVQSDNATYYLLGYSPTNTRSDGRFRRIKVEVADRPGVKIEARPGYFAPKDFRQFTREDKENQLEQAMDLDEPFVDLPMAIEAAYFRQADKKYYVVLAAKIPGSAVSFLKKSVNHQTEFDFAWRATDQKGHPVAAMRDTLPVKLSPETYEQVVSGNFLYEGGFVLPPGNYQLKVAVRENESGKIGTFEEPLVLPEVAAAKSGPGMALSSVVLSNQMQEVQANANFRPRRGEAEVVNPLHLGNRTLLPSVTRVFRTNQNLYIYLESYPVASASGNSPSQGEARGAELLPSVALVFFRGSRKISEAGPFAGKLQKSEKGKTTYFVQLPLEKFPPGRYWMQVNALDPAADRVVFARVPMAIMKAPASPPTAPAAARAGR